MSKPIWFDSPRPVSFGLMMPVREDTMGGDTPRFADLVEMATAARDVGFEALWFGDHLSYEQGGQTVGTWEAWTLMSAMAAAVPGINLGPLVSCSGFRNPGLVAKMTEMIDEVSGGRFILGIGAGWNKPEYDQFGYPFDHRASRFEESIHIIHDLLRAGESTYQGDYVHTQGALNAPRGPRPNGAPILIGSNGDRISRSIARYADAWNSDWQQSPADYLPLLERLDAACDAIGRPRESLVKTGSVRVNVSPQGSFDLDIANYIHEVSAMGISHLVIGLEPRTVESVRAFGQVIADH